ncbi:MAG: HIT domain-containing protein [Bacteriovoracaceae bacterium]
MSSCLFCKILKGEIPSSKVYEDDNVYAFKDIKPLASIHILFINKDHTADVSELINKDVEQVTQIFLAIKNYTKESGLEKKSFRIFTNKGVTLVKRFFIPIFI